MDILFENGLLNKVDYKKVNVVDLTSMPVINKKIASEEVSIKDMLNLVMDEKSLMGSMKVLRHLRSELTDKVKTSQPWSDEEAKYLVACGFRPDGSYSPPTEMLPTTDQYDAVSFNINIKGLASLPTVKALNDRLTAIKEAEANDKKAPKLTTAMKTMVPMLSNFNAVTKSFSKENKIEFIDSHLKLFGSELASVRNKIQQPKFAMILGKRGFSDLDQLSAEQTMDFDHHGQSLKGVVKISRKEVKI